MGHERHLERPVDAARRAFLLRAGTVATCTALFGQAVLTGCARGGAANLAQRRPVGVDSGYGPLQITPDQRGANVLALPAGFTYVTFGVYGEPMSDGSITPRNPDGMAAFPGPDGSVHLVRNHETSDDGGVGQSGGSAPAEAVYDPMSFGGTTTLHFDVQRMELVHDFVSLQGTRANCSGGRASDGMAWLSCEETIAGPEQGFLRKHGYCYLVPSDASAPVEAVPLVAMGRFAHEAVAVDPATGHVYETEDPGSRRGDKSGFYRFRPHDASDLAAGGRLSMLGIGGIPRYDTTLGQRAGEPLPVQWIDIGDPDPELEESAPTVFDQGWSKGAARFRRLEGLTYDPVSATFLISSTDGGDARYGQIWRYDPRAETLTLFFESPGESILDSPDNLVMTPRGGLLVCEDDTTGPDTHALAAGVKHVNALVGLTPEGRSFEFAVNCLNDSELAGPCFSPDGSVLFVNIYGNRRPGTGMTCAITGPWEQGLL